MLKHAYQIGSDLALKEAGARLDSAKALFARHPHLTEILGGGVLGAGVGGPLAYATVPELDFPDAMLLGTLMGMGGGAGTAAAKAHGAVEKLPSMAGMLGGVGVHKLIKKMRDLD